MSALIIITHFDKNGKVKINHKIHQGKLKTGHAGKEIDDGIDDLMSKVADPVRRRIKKAKKKAKKK